MDRGSGHLVGSGGGRLRDRLQRLAEGEAVPRFAEQDRTRAQVQRHSRK